MHVHVGRLTLRRDRMNMWWRSLTHIFECSLTARLWRSLTLMCECSLTTRLMRSLTLMLGRSLAAPESKILGEGHNDGRRCIFDRSGRLMLESRVNTCLHDRQRCACVSELRACYCNRIGPSRFGCHRGSHGSRRWVGCGGDGCNGRVKRHVDGWCPHVDHVALVVMTCDGLADEAWHRACGGVLTANLPTSSTQLDYGIRIKSMIAEWLMRDRISCGIVDGAR